MGPICARVFYFGSQGLFVTASRCGPLQVGKHQVHEIFNCFFKCSWLFQVGVGFKSSTSKTRCFTYAFLLISDIEKIIFSVRRAFRPSKKGRSPFFCQEENTQAESRFRPF